MVMLPGTIGAAPNPAHFVRASDNSFSQRAHFEKENNPLVVLFIWSLPVRSFVTSSLLVAPPIVKLKARELSYGSQSKKGWNYPNKMWESHTEDSHAMWIPLHYQSRGSDNILEAKSAGIQGNPKQWVHGRSSSSKSGSPFSDFDRKKAKPESHFCTLK